MFDQFANSIGVSLVIVLSSAFALVLALNVSRARYKYGIKTPATTGNIDFERSFRAHLNYIENLVIFLPLFLVSIINSGADFLTKNFAFSVFIIGLVWLLSKVTSAMNYINNWNSKVGLVSYVISLLCFILLVIISFSGMQTMTSQIMNPAARNPEIRTR
jgi:glutathione S-transferase